MKVRKIAFPVLIIFTLVIILYFSICMGFLVSDSYTVFEGTSIKSSLPPGFYAYETLSVSESGTLNNSKVVNRNEENTATLKFLNIMPFCILRETALV